MCEPKHICNYYYYMYVNQGHILLLTSAGKAAVVPSWYRGWLLKFKTKNMKANSNPSIWSKTLTKGCYRGSKACWVYVCSTSSWGLGHFTDLTMIFFCRFFKAKSQVFFGKSRQSDFLEYTPWQQSISNHRIVQKKERKD